MKKEKRVPLQVNVMPAIMNIVLDLQRRELRPSNSSMAELLIYEALVARGEIVPIQ